MPQVTVLITTHNYGQFIENAIDSVLNQQCLLENVQIVVVDDGSIDDTSERVKKYGHRIDYFHKPNGGQASALNLGFAKARGEIIALLDADDFFLQGKLARIVEAFQQNPSVGMVYDRLREWHMGTGTCRDWEFNGISGDLHQDPVKFIDFNPQPTSSISFRRAPLRPLLPIPEDIRMLADCYLVALLPFVAPVLAVSDFLTIYRIHGMNSYSTGHAYLPLEVRKERLLKWKIVVKAMYKWLDETQHAQPPLAVQNFIAHWNSLLEREEFAVEPPNRVRFFWHLVQSNRYRFPVMTRRLQLINSLNTLGSLVVGYEKFPLLDKARENLTQWLRTLAGKRSPVR